MKKIIKIILLILSILLVVSFLVSFNGKSSSNEDRVNKISLRGKNVSILGDSISTWDTISNDYINTNSTIKDNEARYPQADLGVSNVNETWWKQVIDNYNANLLVNNSWRGTRVESSLTTRGYHRSIELHDDTGSNSGTNPDIIFVFMGINDLGQSIDSGSFANSYENMIKRLTTKYKDADVFVFTLPHSTYNTAYSNDTLRLSYNSKIKRIANSYDCSVIDLANLKDYNNNINLYANDGLHPNSNGMKMIADLCIEKLNNYYNLND